MAGLSLREILAMAFKALNEAERRQFLTSSEQDKANGFYERALQLGSIPLELEVPRTRSGQFRPSLLPAPYQRSYPEETQSLLLALLASSRSINAAKTALRKLGLSASEQELETVPGEHRADREVRIDVSTGHTVLKTAMVRRGTDDRPNRSTTILISPRDVLRRPGKPVEATIGIYCGAKNKMKIGHGRQQPRKITIRCLGKES